MRPGDGNFGTGAGIQVGVQPDEHTRKAMASMMRYTWKKTWVFWPRRCHLTKTCMWTGAEAYRGYKILNGPGEDILLTKWLTPEAYMFEKIKGNI